MTPIFRSDTSARPAKMAALLLAAAVAVPLGLGTLARGDAPAPRPLQQPTGLARVTEADLPSPPPAPDVPPPAVPDLPETPDVPTPADPVLPADTPDTPASPPATRPATQPATRPSARLSPADLLRQMRDQKAAEQAKPLVAQIDFSGPVVEAPVGFSLFGGSATDFKSIVDRLEAARVDADCRAVLLTFLGGGNLNFAQAQEVRSALDGLRRAGKKTFVYADTFDTISYLVASAATDVVLMDGGEIFMPGVSIEPMFYRGLFDKLGVEPDFVQIGEYKGADESFMRTSPTEELDGEMTRLVESLHAQIVRGVSTGRDIPAGRVREVIDRAMIPAQEAKQLRLVDHLADADGLRQLMQEEFGGDVRIDPAFATGQQPQFDPDNPFSIFQFLKPPALETSGPTVAVVYAEGVIDSGNSGGGGLFGGQSVGSETLRRAMRLVERDDDIKAVVLRIDSPGGSALASEAMYQAVRRVADKKPVVVSIGGMAASGGYYIAVAGDHIVADPAAVVGSIGVVGGKFALGGLYDKLGLTTASFSAGRNADLFGSTSPWDERQRRLIRQWMRSTYDQFTDRVMAGRDGKIRDIEAVARGRIFLAADAIELGMVDQLGGLRDAIAKAAEKAELDDFATVVVGGDEGVVNPLAGTGGFPLGRLDEAAAARFNLLPPDLRRAVSHAVTLQQLLDDRPVVLVMPYQIRIR